MSGPIGLFDSGVGGLTILEALETLFPHEDILYFADTDHFPYGEKNPAEILRYASQITAFLFNMNAKLQIIGCHTASACAEKNLKNAFPFPILGMIQPTIDVLMQTTKNQRIAILSTETTIQTGVYQKEIKKALPEAVIFPLSCPKLAEKIEYGESDSQNLIQACVAPILDQDIDLLLLACTHYSYLQRAIEEELDPNTIVLNPALAVAKSARTMLKEPSDPYHVPHHTFYVSGDTESFQQFLEKHPPKGTFSLQEAIL